MPVYQRQEVEPLFLDNRAFFILYMANKSYSEKLKDPRWQRKRLEVMQRDNFKCAICSTETKTLNVHHKTYKGDPWEQENEDLTTLCEDCHGIISIKETNSGKYLSYIYCNPRLYFIFENGFVSKVGEQVIFTPKRNLELINNFYNGTKIPLRNGNI